MGELLPNVVGVVHGKPAWIADTPLTPQQWVPRAIGKINRTIRGESFDHWALRSYGRAIEMLDPDIVLAQYGMTGAWLAPLCNERGVPLVTHFHGIDATSVKLLSEWGDRYRVGFETASAIIAVSRQMREDLINLGAPAEKVAVCPYGVSLDQFRDSDSATNEPVVLAVGRLVEKKSPVRTIEAFSIAAKLHPNARLKIIGDGPLLDDCINAANRLDLSDRIEFTGALPHDQIAREMSKARLFVQHSMRAPDGDCEGTPVAIIEASASALPIVATRHAGIPDVVQHDVAGIIVEEGDVEGMARGINKLLSDSTAAAEMGKRGRERVRRYYSETASIARLSTVLQRVVEEKSVDANSLPECCHIEY
ncbi:glycosyltransferase [Roseiconus lacunae]|uniref:Glycosyltransferase n=1 Tax=Roseiconus lacunae TaxID=2605694 RepID=A0ABT7PQR5_9BACT|nr:glycosyltransferase [Roseiconus lacunae]MDM4018852.1 glycosyltransferase [Roseiconus lacunae]